MGHILKCIKNLNSIVGLNLTVELLCIIQRKSNVYNCPLWKNSKVPKRTNKHKKTAPFVCMIQLHSCYKDCFNPGIIQCNKTNPSLCTCKPCYENNAQYPLHLYNTKTIYACFKLSFPNKVVRNNASPMTSLHTNMSILLFRFQSGQLYFFPPI